MRCLSVAVGKTPAHVVPASVAPATSDSGARRRRAGARPSTLPPDTTGSSPLPPRDAPDDADTSTPTSSGSASESLTSKSSGLSSTSSTKRSRRPRTVKALAAQVAALATDVLNGDVTGDQLESVRVYASLVRTAAQLITSEVTRARFVRETPDLTLEDPDEEQDD